MRSSKDLMRGDRPVYVGNREGKEVRRRKGLNKRMGEGKKVGVFDEKRSACVRGRESGCK